LKIQPILELKGIRIELSLKEAEAIARQPVAGADRVQKEVKILVEAHHSTEQVGLIPTADGPHKRLDGSHPMQDKKITAKKSPKAKKDSPRIACEYCGGRYAAKIGMSIHLHKCEAKEKVEARAADDAARDLQSRTDVLDADHMTPTQTEGQ
jgi:hypothetical protein